MDEQLKSNESSSLQIKELFYKYIRFLPLFIISVILSVFIAFIYLRYVTPTYRSSGSLIIKDESGGGMGGGANDKFQQMFVIDAAKNIQNEIQILRSRPLLQLVTKDLNLGFSYYVKGNVRETSLYKENPFTIEALQIADSSKGFSLKIEFEKEKFRIDEGKKLYSIGDVFSNSYGKFILRCPYPTQLSKEYKVEWKPTSIMAAQLASHLTINMGSAAGSVVIALETYHPVLAADFINQLMKEYQVVTIADKNTTKKQTIEFIDDRLKVISTELDSITRELLKYQQENNLIGEADQSSNYISKFEDADNSINEQQIQLAVAQMIENYVGNTENMFNIVPSTFGLNEGVVANLIAAYNVAQLERKALIDAKIPATNLRVSQKEEQIRRIRENLFEGLRNYKTYINSVIVRLKKKSNEVQALLQALPVKQQNLAEIRKQQQMKQAVLNFLLEKREEIAMSLAATISNSRVLEPAVVIKRPVSPDSKSVQLISILVGLALPGLFIFMLEFLNDKVDNRSDIEKITNAPILGELGHSFNTEMLTVNSGNRSVVAEQFRIIRSNLQFVLSNLKKPVLLVTSSFSGEGKSFISANIGAVMSLANKRTIILEFDIRKPKILSSLNLPKRPGLTNFLLGKTSLEELPFAVPGYDNLFVMACGPVPPNPAELLLDPKLADLFAYLKQNFDVIVIDTPPVGMVSDAMTLSQFADATLYIVRQGHTFKKQIFLIDEFYRQKKLPKISLLLNDVKVRTGYGYYGYGRYGYGKAYAAYGSGYFEEDGSVNKQSKFKSWFGWMGLSSKKSKKRKKAKV